MSEQTTVYNDDGSITITAVMVPVAEEDREEAAAEAAKRTPGLQLVED